MCIEIVNKYNANSKTLYGKKIDEYNRKQIHGKPPSRLMQPISEELTRKYLADQSHLKIRGKKSNNNEPIDVDMKNITSGFSKLGVPLAAALTSAIDVRLNTNGIIAPIEHKLLGLAKAGFIKSRFFKMLSHYSLWKLFN